jgi:Na+/H+ antiporter NhaD/arsenite permease-like protein
MITLISAIFIAGYLLIAAEHIIKINKAATALITGVACWVVYIISATDSHLISDTLSEHLGEMSGILFFLLSAMTIVELIDSHSGFNIITEKITQTNKKSLLWIVGVLTFFLSAILDNLTTTIVLISLLRKLMKDKMDRMYFAGIVVIAANAGGAWSPIGDVTTTMLWIGGQITAVKIISKLLLPSLACLVLPLLIVSMKMNGHIENPAGKDLKTNTLSAKHQKIILFAGIAILISVPVFKTLTGLPPYMGILLGLGIIWVITEILHKSKNDEEKQSYTVVHALRKIDTSTILFFLGILIAISALQSTGILVRLAESLSGSIHNQSIIIIIIGLLSSIVDNVPLVAAVQGMYDLTQYPTDNYFWEFLAYSAGTGGSALVIGSAAGVAAMGMENINFFWYLKKITWLALVGFFAGAGVYILQDIILH